MAYSFQDTMQQSRMLLHSQPRVTSTAVARRGVPASDHETGGGGFSKAQIAGMLLATSATALGTMKVAKMLSKKENRNKRSLNLSDEKVQAAQARQDALRNKTDAFNMSGVENSNYIISAVMVARICEEDKDLRNRVLTTLFSKAVNMANAVAKAKTEAEKPPEKSRILERLISFDNWKRNPEINDATLEGRVNDKTAVFETMKAIWTRQENSPRFLLPAKGPDNVMTWSYESVETITKDTLQNAAEAMCSTITNIADKDFGISISTIWLEWLTNARPTAFNAGTTHVLGTAFFPSSA